MLTQALMSRDEWSDEAMVIASRTLLRFNERAVEIRAKMRELNKCHPRYHVMLEGLNAVVARMEVKSTEVEEKFLKLLTIRKERRDARAK
jgi:hypothetical protein